MQSFEPCCAHPMGLSEILCCKRAEESIRGMLLRCRYACSSQHYVAKTKDAYLFFSLMRYETKNSPSRYTYARVFITSV